MPRRDQSEWVSGKEAAAILTKKSGHPISQSYVRYLAFKVGKLAHRPVDGRTNEYRRSDVEQITVRRREPKQQGDREVDRVA